MKIVFFGTPDFVLPILQKLESHHTIVGVVTAPDHIAGRKKTLTPSPVKEYAAKNFSTSILTPYQFTDEIGTQLKKLSPDLFIVAAYGKIIPVDILSIPKKGSLNIHPSLLPLYRGPSPIQSML